MTVHNHGPEEGPGLNCAERKLSDGSLRGACIDALTRPMLQRARRTVHALRKSGKHPNLANLIHDLADRLQHVAYDDAWAVDMGGELIGPYLDRGRAERLGARLAETRSNEAGGAPIEWSVRPIYTRSARG